jgi:ribosomal protein S12 methylthiotransferase
VERVHLVSLGCPKNRVDSEVMVGTLLQGDFELVNEPDDADVIIVNTCSFIQPATEESIETVLDMAKYKEGQCKKLVVTGCMVQRYGDSLEGEFPEVDHFLGTGEYHRIAEVLTQRDGAQPKSFVDVPMYLHDEMAPRINSWSKCSAYLKISEGCDHRCAFCIIPQLRGRLRSRTVDSLMVEAKRLASEGVKELNLISQDSTAYGRDLKDGSHLGQLVRALHEIEGIEWIRVHYAYPHGVPADFLSAMAELPKVVPYIDIPLQHASGSVLKAMRRGVTRAGQERILDRLHGHVSDLAVRTTFIVGFPGETEEDFQILCDFVRERKFHHVGVFTYFQEDGTVAAEMDRQVADDIKIARQAKLMNIQAEISEARLRALVGTTVDVLIEGVSEESSFLLTGRTAWQAPDVDGKVFITSAPDDVAVGQIRACKVVQSGQHDLVAEIMDLTV